MQKKEEQNNTTLKKEDFECCGIGGGASHDHEPPIGVGRGSCFLDLGYNYDFRTETPKLVNGYYEYELDRQYEGEYIDKIAILIEEGDTDGKVSFCTFEFADTHNATLRLWQGRTRDSTLTTPQTIINGAGGGTIKSKSLLNAKYTIDKTARDKRCGYSNPALKVVKWQIDNGDPNSIIKDPDGNELAGYKDDMYYFWVSLYHPDPPTQ